MQRPEDDAEDKLEDMREAARDFLEKVQKKLSRQEIIEYMFMIVKLLLEDNEAPKNVVVMSISHYAHLALDLPRFTDPNHDTDDCFVCDAMHDHILKKIP